MPSTEAPTWWADVQQEREDLAGSGRRPADDWLDEEIDFVPRRRRRIPADDSSPRPRRGAHAPAHAAAEHPMHGVFVPATEEHAVPRAATAVPAAASVTIERDSGVVVAQPSDVAHELRHLRAADDPFATPPPPAGQRRTVQIKGRPEEARVPSLARRHRPRTASDRVGHRPDRMALWAVLLGVLLIVLAAVSA